MSVRSRDRGDPGLSVLPDYFQHCSGRSGKGGAAGILWDTIGASWVGLGGVRSQHSLLCGQRLHSGLQPHLDP